MFSIVIIYYIVFGLKILRFAQDDSGMDQDESESLRMTAGWIRMRASHSGWKREALHQFDSGFVTFCAHFVRPDAGLDLADVSLSQKEHAQTGLSDTAADRIW